jgi:hypothetical protein
VNCARDERLQAWSRRRSRVSVPVALVSGSSVAVVGVGPAVAPEPGRQHGEHAEAGEHQEGVAEGGARPGDGRTVVTEGSLPCATGDSDADDLPQTSRGRQGSGGHAQTRAAPARSASRPNATSVAVTTTTAAPPTTWTPVIPVVTAQGRRPPFRL